MTEPLTLDGAARLSHLGVMRASGADAAKFLNGQLTSDFAHLVPGQARLAGFCSAKGRLQASFIGWKSADGEFLLAVAASVLPATLKRLSMFVMRSQCKLSDAGAEWALCGVVGASALRLTTGLLPWGIHETTAGTVIRLPDAAGLARAMLVQAQAPSAPSSPVPLLESLPESWPVSLQDATMPAIPLDAWRWLEVQSGVPCIEAATFEQFVPQMVNFELLGGVDFQKGCYPGQEVVARSQYRGGIKRRTFLFDTPALAHAGQEVYHGLDPQQPAGMVVNAAPQWAGSGSSVLVELKIATLGGGTLHLGAADGPELERRELPYPVPIDTASPG